MFSANQSRAVRNITCQDRGHVWRTFQRGVGVGTRGRVCFRSFPEAHMNAKKINDCGSYSYELEEESKRCEECAELQQVVCYSHAALTPVMKRTRVVAVVMNRCCPGAPRHQFSISGHRRFVAGPDLVLSAESRYSYAGTFGVISFCEVVGLQLHRCLLHFISSGCRVTCVLHTHSVTDV